VVCKAKVSGIKQRKSCDKAENAICYRKQLEDKPNKRGLNAGHSIR